jgi:hypothetical protein
MKTIIEQLKEWKENIEFDIKQDWCDDKTTNMLQLFRLEQAISLLENLGQNNNIPND